MIPPGTLSSPVCEVWALNVASFPATSPCHRVTFPVKLPPTR